MACSLLPMRSFAMRVVSSTVSVRGPVAESFPLISTMGGRPGEKNRSLILLDTFSIDTSNAGVEDTGGLGAGAVPGAMDTVGAGGVMVDIGKCKSKAWAKRKREF